MSKTLRNHTESRLDVDARVPDVYTRHDRRSERQNLKSEYGQDYGKIEPIMDELFWDLMDDDDRWDFLTLRFEDII